MSRLQRISETASIQSASALTDSELAGAVASTQINVHAIVVSTDTAGTVTLESGGTTRKFELYPGANGGIAMAGSEPYDPLFECDAGESLTVTTNITGNQFILVKYSRSNA